MGRRRRVMGYRSQRGGGGCVSVIIWLGILVNLGLIAYTLSDGNTPLAALLRLPSDDAGAALRAFEDGDFDSAITRAQAALAADSSNTAAAMTLTRALVYRSYTDFRHADDLPGALDAATDALRANPNDPNALAAQAFALQANGRPVEAVDVAERALEIAPDHTLARTALALGYARVGSFETALRESEAALANAGDAPEAFEARRAVAISTADLGRYAEAGDLIQALIDDHRRVIPLYFERALYARQVSQPEIAENAYFAVLNMDETNVKAHLRLCEFASSIGERDTAFTQCTRVTELAPSLADGWYRLGRLHFLAGEFEQAQARLNRCSTLQVAQNTPPAERIFECWYLQGQAAEILGDCDALIATYNQFQIIAADPAVRETWTYPPEGPPMCQ